MFGLLPIALHADDDHTLRVGPQDALQKIVDRLQPGDTLSLKPGLYHQSLVIRASGTNNQPIRILGEKGVVFSGLKPLNVSWKQIRPGVYQAKVEHPVRQLFINREMMIPARWPNMTFQQRWDNSKWPSADQGSQYGTLVDSDLATSGIDFTGCVAILNIGSWQTYRRVIEEHGVQRDRFTYTTEANHRLQRSKKPVEMDRYCIYGEAALDAPGEWFYDHSNSMLTLFPPNGEAPNELIIESKEGDPAITGDGCRHLHLSRIEFVATTFRMKGVSDCVFDDLTINFGSTVSDPFKANHPLSSQDMKEFTARKWFGETSVDALTEVVGNDNVIRNIVIRHSEGPALTVGGKRNLIDNCLFQDIDWQGLDYGFGIDLLAAAPVTIRYVTLDHCGGSEGLRLANHGASLVEYCHLHHCGLRQSDGAIIQTSGARSAGTEIRYNWIHDHQAFHWGGNGIRGDDGARGLNIHHNIVWNCREKAIVTKGDQHRVYHNTCFNNDKIDILIPRNRLPGKTNELSEQNTHTRVFNNWAGVTGSWDWEKPKMPPYGFIQNNLPPDANYFQLGNFDSTDFRPRSKHHPSADEPDGKPSTPTNQLPHPGAYGLDEPRRAVGYQSTK